MIKEIIETIAILDRLITPDGYPIKDHRGLNKSQRKYLVILSFYEGSKLSKIQKKMDMTKGNVSIISDFLQKKELITCKRETDDRRVVIARLTDNGRIAAEEYAKIMADNINSYFNKKARLNKVRDGIYFLHNDLRGIK